MLDEREFAITKIIKNLKGTKNKSLRNYYLVYNSVGKRIPKNEDPLKEEHDKKVTIYPRLAKIISRPANDVKSLEERIKEEASKARPTWYSQNRELALKRSRERYQRVKDELKRIRDSKKKFVNSKDFRVFKSKGQ